MSKMELEALRDRKRMGHLKEMERLLKEALPGQEHVFAPDTFVTAITSPVRLFGVIMSPLRWAVAISDLALMMR